MPSVQVTSTYREKTSLEINFLFNSTVTFLSTLRIEVNCIANKRIVITLLISVLLPFEHKPFDICSF